MTMDKEAQLIREAYNNQSFLSEFLDMQIQQAQAAQTGNARRHGVYYRRVRTRSRRSIVGLDCGS